jgi:hypothetical protein
LLQEQSKRVTAGTSLAVPGAPSTAGAAVKSIVKQVLIGDVRDRGGRANEVRSKQLKDDLRRPFGGNYRGSGGREGKGKGGGGGAISADATAAPSSMATATDRKGGAKEPNQSAVGAGKKEGGIPDSAGTARGNRPAKEGGDRAKGGVGNRESTSGGGPSGETARTMHAMGTTAVGAESGLGSGRTVSVTALDTMPTVGTDTPAAVGQEQHRKLRHRNRNKGH